MKIPVLDSGYVALVGTWGSEEQIIEAARMSTGGGFRGWDTEAGLLRYLYTHGHMTPFEMAGLTVEVKAPIFVVREWHRHRTQSYNEMSARYAPLPDEDYLPSIERIMAKPTGNKQAGSATGNTISASDARTMQAALQAHYAASQQLYAYLLATDAPKELARLCLPVGRYTRMRASANLRNWLQFLALRLPDSAQWEIRQYAKAVETLIAENFPRTHAQFSAVRSD